MFRWVSVLAICAVYNGPYGFGVTPVSGYPLGDNALDWIQQKTDTATNEISSAKQHLGETINQLIDDGKIEIDISVDKALQDISTFKNNVPEICDETATKALTELRISKKAFFLSCAANADSVRAIANLKSNEVGADFFSMTRDGTNDIVECSNRGVIEAYKCGTSAVWEIVKNVMSSYSEMKRFITSLTAKATHARRDIYDCLHPDGIDIQDHVDKAMADYHTCLRILRSKVLLP